jgi:hypothetical protein
LCRKCANQHGCRRQQIRGLNVQGQPSDSDINLRMVPTPGQESKAAMHISGITTCVGTLYAAHLARTLPVWLNTLDSLTVATLDNDKSMIEVWHEYIWRQGNRRLRIAATDAFTKNGAHFNKGAALNAAYAQARPSDWVLSLDCDVLPPPDWRDHLKDIEPGTLYGCKRTDKLATQPWGYFQLWHARDTQAGPFVEHYGHAGRYDTEFFNRWPTNRRKVLPFMVEHLGEPAKHWHGEGNEHLTAALFGQGVSAFRARDERLPAAPQATLTACANQGAEPATSHRATARRPRCDAVNQ